MFRIKTNLLIGIIICFFILVISLLSYSATTTISNEVENGKTVPIIMYHSILNEQKRAGKFILSQTQLENDLQYLLENGYTTITVSDLIKYIENVDVNLPEKPIIITFDDGYYNNYFYAFPLMQKYNTKCVISVVGEYSAKNKLDEKLSANYSHLTWEQMKEMQQSNLVEIANHSYNMHVNSGKRYGSSRKSGESIDEYSNIFKEDTNKLQNILLKQAEITPVCYTFPFGKMSQDAIPLLKEMGFKATLSCYEKINCINKDSDLFGLYRFNRPSGKTSKQYFDKILFQN